MFVRGHDPAGASRSQPTRSPARRSAVPDVLRSPGHTLDAGVRRDMQARLGANFSDVRIHSDRAARDSAAEIGARAYTAGSHVVLGEGGDDRRTLAHELVHVVQQRVGPVSGSQINHGFRISAPTDRLEREADTIATHALSRTPKLSTQEPARAGGMAVTSSEGPAERAAEPPVPGRASPLVVQRAYEYNTRDDVKFTTTGDRARKVLVTNLWAGNNKGIELGRGANSPGFRVNPWGWERLRNAGQTKHHPDNAEVGNPLDYVGAVRAHLWAGRLGGPGNDIHNLVCLPQQTNSDMSANAETHIKNLLFERDGNGNYNTVWMTTALSFADDNLDNRSDFLSVIPNGLTMNWGLMVDGQFHHDSANTWSASNIKVPGYPLSPSDTLEFTFWEGGFEDLIQAILPFSAQARAAVLDTVPSVYQLAVANAYPEAFFSVSNAEQSLILAKITLDQARSLGKRLYSVYAATPRIAMQLVTEAFLVNLPSDVLSVVMAELDKNEQKLALLSCFDELESRLPEFVLHWSLASWEVYFQLAEERAGELFHEWVQAGQLRGYTLVDRMKELTSTEELMAVIDNWKYWTSDHGCGFDFDREDWTAYLLEKIGSKYQTYLDAANARTSARLIEQYWGGVQTGQGGGMQIE